MKRKTDKDDAFKLAQMATLNSLKPVHVPRRQAIRHAKSRQAYWHMAKTIASGVGITNAWLDKQGLICLKALWAELAPLRRTAWCGPARQVVWGGRPAMAVLTRFIRLSRLATNILISHFNVLFRDVKIIPVAN